VEQDLAEAVSRLGQRLVAAERPILDGCGLTMWEYIALTLLMRRDEVPSQQALALAMGYDKTRLIHLLDGLEQRALVTRSPAPSDRRAHVVRITAAGRRSFRAAHKAIRAIEDELLSDLSPAEQRVLRDTLSRLATPPTT
jgi:DNA-binding MarR family transcriptional regulator